MKTIKSIDFELLEQGIVDIYFDNNWHRYKLVNDEVEIIEEDKKETIVIEDNEGNKREYPINLNDVFKKGEYLRKENGIWYIHKKIEPNEELQKWIDTFDTKIYYSLEDKKIEDIKKYYDEEIESYVAETYIDGNWYKELYNSRYDEMIINKINELIDKVNRLKGSDKE